ncbi:type II secretion system protein [Hydrogenimonas urashimensis]|uniref:type II secretion system protein n=1 Tax=Hydrogenimonas urashimensis TaxID=2740515 RepID=UPI0019167B64|nr:type II secretion system protein [Hydrogenimonas urashimensis]
MRRAFTLIEIIMVIVITGILAIGTFKALNALFIRSVKARAVTELSLNTQAVLDQLSMLLYNRIPASVIGYDPSDGSVQPLGSILSAKPVLEWLGTAEEALTFRKYSGFIDMNRSSYATRTLFSPDSDGFALNRSEQLKFGHSEDIYGKDLIRLVFAGTFDEGDVAAGDPVNAFAWHGGRADGIFAIRMRQNGEIVLSGSPAYIYEKYYLADSAYAVARAKEIDKNAACIKNLPTKVADETLLLFYDYRPWKGESFCADPKGAQAGKVTVLAEDVSGFRAETVNRTIRLGIDMLRAVRGASPVHISKQKVVF